LLIIRNTCNLYSDDESVVSDYAVAETNDNDSAHDYKNDQNSGRKSGAAFTREGMSNYVGHREVIYNIWGTNVVGNFC
jgi:hypothetical protein